MKYKATGMYLLLLFMVCNVETNAGTAYSKTTSLLNKTQLRDGTFADFRLINRVTEGLARLLIDHPEALELLARKHVSRENITIPISIIEQWSRYGILVKDSSILTGGMNLKVPQNIVRCAIVVNQNGLIVLQSPIRLTVGTA